MRGIVFIAGLLIYLDERGGNFNPAEFFGLGLMFLAMIMDDD